MQTNKNVYDQVFGLAPSKSQQTMISIAEAAIHNFSQLGIENTTFDTIAKRCKLSRTIVVRYFPDKDSLFVFVAKYVRATYQQYVIQRFSDKGGAEKKLESYIEAAMTWVNDMPEHGATWLLFFYYCGIRPAHRKLNTELVEMGVNRISSILEQGIKEEVFKIAHVKKVARSVQLHLSGAIMALLTESKEFNPGIIKETQRFCLKIASHE